jgi:hypothetical protein
MTFRRLLIDETLPIINKSNHQKKGEYKEQNGRTHLQEDKRIAKRGQTNREHQVLELIVVKSISNKERGGPLERTPTIEDLNLSQYHL